MDTTTQFSANALNPEIAVLIDNGRCFDYDTCAELQHWTELSRFVTDVSQLFHVYRWNYAQLIRGIDIYTNGELEDVRDNGTLEPVEIIVNGYTMNMISSGRALVEFAEAFCDHATKQGLLKDNFLSGKLKNEFDSNFYYILACSLRDQSQHGQLIVSSTEDLNGALSLGFDIYQLINPAHFTVKTPFKTKAQNILSTLQNRSNGPVTLSYAASIDAINESYSRLFSEFLEQVKPLFQKASSEAEEFLAKSPDRIIDNPSIPCSAILTEDQDDGTKVAHFLVGGPGEMLKSFEALQNEAEAAFRDADNNLAKTREPFKPIE